MTANLPPTLALAMLSMAPPSSMVHQTVSKDRALQADQAGSATGMASSRARAVPDDGEKVLLSGREQEVLELIARGFSYAEISRLKGVSVHTVQTHIKSLYSKLAVHSKSEAVFEATGMVLLPQMR